MVDKQFVEEIQKIVRQAGQFILRESISFDKTKIHNKNDFDLVSYVDIETEKKLIHLLSNLMSEAGIIAEEAHFSNSQKEWNWIIDPLDGTTNFTRALPLYAISVGLAYKNNLQAGVVFNIPLNEMFWAIRDKGAYLNNQSVRISNTSDLSSSLIATGFSVSHFDKTDIHLSVLKEIITRSLGVRRMGVASIDLCYVACGKFDGFFEWYLNSWDVAAGSLIAQEAGAIVSDFSGQNNFLFGKEILAAQPNIYQQLITIIQKKLSL